MSLDWDNQSAFGLQKGGGKDEGKEGKEGEETKRVTTIIQWRQYVILHCAPSVIKTQEVLQQ